MKLALLIIALLIVIALCEYQRQQWERDNPDVITNVRPMARKH
jgi:hypothetical protein